MYTLGVDIGSSSVKVALVEVNSGQCVASAHYPQTEAPIISHHAGWAEQHPEDWWTYLQHAITSVFKQTNIDSSAIKAIGITYQMHGLVCVDKQQKVIRPSIIWCDSRAISYGENAFRSIGEDYCLKHFLNSPGNFTAAKLAWVKEHETKSYDQIDFFMLPGDYIAMKMTGEIHTTTSGLSEGILWDFKNNSIAHKLLQHFQINPSHIPALCPTFGEQGRLTKEAAKQLHLTVGTPVTYRAGDQPNNALSLNVFEPGEFAANAGTSGVIYGINNTINYDTLSRVNSFAHVNHRADNPRLGVLLCINGTGILNSWCKRNIVNPDTTYDTINRMAATAPIGSQGVCILPFGNGAERVLGNKDIGCSIHGVNFNIHRKEHILRAAQEGIVFAFKYGIDIMKEMGMPIHQIHASNSNMFMSPLFRTTLANITGATIKLYDTDSATGAAKGAAIGAGIYKNTQEAFGSLKCLMSIEPDTQKQEQYQDAYTRWKAYLNKQLQLQ